MTLSTFFSRPRTEPEVSAYATSWGIDPAVVPAWTSDLEVRGVLVRLDPPSGARWVSAERVLELARELGR